MIRIDTRSASARDALEELRQKLSPRGDIVSEAGRQKTLDVFGEALAPMQVVERICREVAERGIEAVLRYTQQLDGRTLEASELRVSPEQLEEAHRAADPEFLETIRAIRDRLMAFQSQILPESVVVRRDPGIVLEHRYVPLRRVGICVPGGAAAYPSTVLMTAVPALAAGVTELAVVAPPTPFGADNPDVQAVCQELGIREVYRVGGAQAVAALAYGVEGIAAVDKIVGPGNLFVALAKKHVFGHVDIDAIAGPSEVVVIADDSVSPDWVALDLLAQAEHSPGSAVLVTWLPSVLEAVNEAVARRLETLDRADVTRVALEEYGRLVLARDEWEACQVARELAPEHLHIETARPRELLEQIPTAGAVFLGAHTPVALGDYVAGPSHVLPTGGTARFASGLAATSFLRSHSVIEYSQEGLVAEASWVAHMAEREGLTAHRDSVLIRRQQS